MLLSIIIHKYRKRGGGGGGGGRAQGCGRGYTRLVEPLTIGVRVYHATKSGTSDHCLAS